MTVPSKNQESEVENPESPIIDVEAISDEDEMVPETKEGIKVDGESIASTAKELYQHLLLNRS